MIHDLSIYKESDEFVDFIKPICEAIRNFYSEIYDFIKLAIFNSFEALNNYGELEA